MVRPVKEAAVDLGRCLTMPSSTQLGRESCLPKESTPENQADLTDFSWSTWILLSVDRILANSFDCSLSNSCDLRWGVGCSAKFSHPSLEIPELRPDRRSGNRPLLSAAVESVLSHDTRFGIEAGFGTGNRPRDSGVSSLIAGCRAGSSVCGIGTSVPESVQNISSTGTGLSPSISSCATESFIGAAEGAGLVGKQLSRASS
mmetsp:Transcript_12674/g.28013  ORF Transcript_12674/g.28013 Transcript_12674/m.28013 type:complete len:202 (+) Transcript_12674:1365-1970(+)